MNYNFNKLKEPYVLILIGPPLVGKSTFLQKNFSTKNVNVISRDQIVMDVYGDNYNDAFKKADQKRVNSILDKQLRSANSNGDNVIVDMTNLSSKRRRHTLSYFDDDYNKIAIVFPIPSIEEINRRNTKRTMEENKTIPDHVIKNMIDSYQFPKLEEGFNKIISL